MNARRFTLLFLLMVSTIAFAQDSLNLHLVWSINDSISDEGDYITVHDNTLYYGGWGRIQTFDLSQLPQVIPSQTIHLNYQPPTYYATDSVWRIRFVGNYAYIACCYNGGGLIDQIISPDSFVFVQSYHSFAKDFLEYRHHMYVLGVDVAVFDSGNAVLTPNYTFRTSSNNWSSKMVILDTTMYILTNHGVLIAGLHDASRPDSIGFLPTNGTLSEMIVQDTMLYVLSSRRPSQLVVYNITSRNQPVYYRQFQFADSVHAITKSNNLWFSNGDTLLQVYREDSIARLSLVGYYNLSIPPESYPGVTHLAVDDHYVFLYDGFTKLMFDFAPVLDIPERGNQIIPSTILLGMPYPNPFNSTTTIRYSLPVSTSARIDIFDAIGRHVETLDNGYRKVGETKLSWNASNYSSGTYFVRLIANHSQLQQKVVLTK